MSKALLIFHQKTVFPDGSLIETKAWAVSKVPRTPEGIKYSLVYINARGERVLGYDNAEGKGHHRHDVDKETKVNFKSIEELAGQFLREVSVIRRKL
jgi:hypothetical protein